MDTAEKMLADLEVLVCSELDNSKKRECIRIAYAIGKSDGRVEGAQWMGDVMTESLNRSLDKMTAKVTA
jgi:hypothetical protein